MLSVRNVVRGSTAIGTSFQTLNTNVLIVAIQIRLNSIHRLMRYTIMNNKEYYELLELLMINGVSFLDAIDQLKEGSDEENKRHC